MEVSNRSITSPPLRNTASPITLESTSWLRINSIALIASRRDWAPFLSPSSTRSISAALFLRKIRFSLRLSCPPSRQRRYTERKGGYCDSWVARVCSRAFNSMGFSERMGSMLSIGHTRRVANVGHTVGAVQSAAIVCPMLNAGQSRRLPPWLKRPLPRSRGQGDLDTLLHQQR